MIVLPLAPFPSDPGTHTNGSFFYFLKLLFVIERNFHHYPDDSLYVATISDNHTSKIKYFEQHKAPPTFRKTCNRNSYCSRWFYCCLTLSSFCSLRCVPPLEMADGIFHLNAKTRESEI
ncbi:hypothetical protein NG271_082 [Saccharomyces cerevisiae synthetic construct]|uniref:Putative uncharacterized protein YDL162C n=1 Tax=Saccharomyces cerevisiae (strain ATCC 204508 / S288c) TaxID=559292 RepID=YD162_YEAST|nr:RecName: Full=Putative uncharacterized protein YDL162C [Saccharomyces cerevisiae S288C]KZV12061.1 hypothetical protein WN66_00875 [Saccharomyces cerevisiae]WNF19641.1 hypothetical protein NG271_082 [Saccharomyces cerevisiae synthetic construct]CAA91584.1 putative protein [Saccharomyces cerevisiae]CAA98735.1 unnamed protein product [Saccharomyces cerevisiae]